MSDPLQLNLHFTPEPQQLTMNFAPSKDCGDTAFKAAKAGAAWAKRIEEKLLAMLAVAPVTLKQPVLARRLGCLIEELWAVRRLLRNSGRTSEQHRGQLVTISLTERSATGLPPNRDPSLGRVSE